MGAVSLIIWERSGGESPGAAMMRVLGGEARVRGGRRAGGLRSRGRARATEVRELGLRRSLDTRRRDGCGHGGIARGFFKYLTSKKIRRTAGIDIIYPGTV